MEKGDKKLLKRLVKEVLEKSLKEVKLGKYELTKLIENKKYFGSRIVEVIKELSITKPSKEALEMPKYQGPRPIKEQIKAIAKIFDLSPLGALEYAKNLPKLPEEAEGWFAVPSLNALTAKYFSEINSAQIDFQSTDLRSIFKEDDELALMHCQGIEFMFSKLENARMFRNYHKKRIWPRALRLHSRTERALDLLEREQRADILIIAAQLGKRYEDCSVQEAYKAFRPNEFGLDSFIVGSIIITHPELLLRNEDMGIDCAGDVFGLDGNFSQTPFFGFYNDKVEFGAGDSNEAYENYGSASGFLLKSIF